MFSDAIQVGEGAIAAEEVDIMEKQLLHTGLPLLASAQ